MTSDRHGDQRPRRARHVHDPDAARAFVAEAFASHELRIGRAGSLDFELDIAATPRLSTARMSYGVDISIVGAPMRDCYHFNFLSSGESTVEHRGRREDFTAGRLGVAFGPDAPITILWTPDARHRHLNVRREALEEAASRLLGGRVGEDLAFDLTFPLLDGPGRALLKTLTFLHEQLDDRDGLPVLPRVEYELESALVTQVLLTVPHRFTAELRRSDGPPRSTARVRDVRAYIEEHATEALTVADLAAAFGVSVRAMQIGFRREFGVSPTTCIRNARLDLARRELQIGDATVTEVAVRLGFTHLSRFAGHYRDRFGELPSQTARVRRT